MSLQIELPRNTETARDAASTLISMHTYMRPDQTTTEEEFIATWIDPLGVDMDLAGNRSLQVGPDPKVMFSCHTDTVHKVDGRQKLAVVDEWLRLTKKAKKRSNCLGADDTAGVWLLREMILAKKPGLYIFHRGEESFGIGSEYIARKNPETVGSINAAIAFDRMGKHSIITHQMCGRCCSDTFAESLSDAIGLGHVKDSGGSFTDTANYTDLVPECTNVSIGYEHAHSERETLDCRYALKLREAMLEFDADKLVIKREPGTGSYDYADDYLGYGYEDQVPYSVADQSYGRAYGVTLYDLILDNPNEVADILEHYGMDVDTLATAIINRGGFINGKRNSSRFR